VKEREAKTLRDKIISECSLPANKVTIQKPWNAKSDWEFVIEIMLPNDKLVMVNEEYEYSVWKKGILETLEVK
jgi:hypothetical protein